MSLATIQKADLKAGFAIARTMRLEGGVSDVAGDPGGVTNGGVSLRYALAEIKLHPDQLALFDVDHDGHVDRRDILGLTPDEKADIYFEDWWTPSWFEQMSPSLIAWKCFDIAVNTGPNRSALLLQAALGHSGSAVPVDGQVGPTTVAAVTRQAAIDGGVVLLTNIRLEQADFYKGLVAKEPEFLKFRTGWLNRAAA